MQISHIAAQLRTTDLESSIRFYTSLPGFTLAFQYQDFYAGIRVGDHPFHLKLVDTKDPSISASARCTSRSREPSSSLRHAHAGVVPAAPVA